MDARSLKSFFTKNIEWFIHFAIWTFMISERWINHAPKHDNPVLYGTYQTVFLIFTVILPVYLNAMVFIPKYLKKSQWVKYILAIVPFILAVNVLRGLLTVLYLYLQHFEFDFYEEFIKWTFRDYQSFDKFIFSPTSWILWLSFAYRFVKDWFMNEKIRSRLLAENYAMELALLKSQLNPHFLFNSMNSIYALALGEKAHLTADGVAKMGTLMRYTLHDSQVERIPLNKEIDYIEKYIALQKLRIVEERKASIQITIDVEEAYKKRVAPMLLMPFIENAFKHGISLVEDIYIEIKITLTGNVLEMTVKNIVHQNQDMESGGIGLKNVENRLSMIYPNRYDLKRERQSNLYIVHLKIDLEE